MIPQAHTSRTDLPPIAGLALFDEAIRIGLSVDQCLHEIFIKRLTAEPICELKMGFSLHAYYCAEHAAAWRKRVGEMREPPLGLEAVPDPALDALFG